VISEPEKQSANYCAQKHVADMRRTTQRNSTNISNNPVPTGEEWIGWNKWNTCPLDLVNVSDCNIILSRSPARCLVVIASVSVLVDLEFDSRPGITTTLYRGAEELRELLWRPGDGTTCE